MKQTINLAFPGGTYIAIEAEVFGEWAVHESFGRCDWVITHVPSGLAATCAETSDISEQDAIRVARHLARTVPHIGAHIGTLRRSAERQRSTGQRDRRYARLGNEIRREIRNALGLADCAVCRSSALTAT